MPIQRRKRTPRDQRLVALPDPFLECRINRHDLTGKVEYQRWRYNDDDTLESRTTCARCGTVQIREVSETTGDIYRPTRYEYATGYLVRLMEGEERVTRSAVRLESVRRILERLPDIPRVRRGE